MSLRPLKQLDLDLNPDQVKEIDNLDFSKGKKSVEKSKPAEDKLQIHTVDLDSVIKFENKAKEITLPKEGNTDIKDGEKTNEQTGTGSIGRDGRHTPVPKRGTRWWNPIY